MWLRPGFWMFSIVSILFSLAVLLEENEVGLGFLYIALISIGILYGCLHLKKQGKSCWHLMENSMQWGKHKYIYWSFIGYIIIFSIVNIVSYTKPIEESVSYLNDKGDIYYNGEGVEKDYDKAFKWYEKAAQQGDAVAQCSLGVMYGNGQGVAQDYAKAKEWCERAAEQGHAAAQYNLGVVYDNGQGVAQNYAKAREWYEKAAQQGYTDAQKQLNNLKAKGY
jgi:hypothetical protein